MRLRQTANARFKRENSNFGDVLEHRRL